MNDLEACTGPSGCPSRGGFAKDIANTYWIWRMYHFLVADAVSLQRPTKDAYVYQFLGQDLGRVADIGCGPGVFT